MILKVILAVFASAAIGYSAVPLVASQTIEATCCSDDGHCPTAYQCVFKIGVDCSSQRTGYCEPVPR